jgi:hypothetical protein
MSLVKNDPRQILSCGIFYSILTGPAILSNQYLALMSIDRTIMILYPTSYRLIITRRHVLIRIFLFLIMIMLLMIPHNFYYYYDKNTTLFICEFYTFIEKWRLRLWPFAHAICFVSIPSIITCISSIILLQNRCKHRRITKNNLSENARRIERNSIFILFVSIIVFFSLLPSVILEIFIMHDLLFSHEIYCSSRRKTYKILLNWFLILAAGNYSSKFYIRLLISKTFRRDFIQLIKCILPRKEIINEQHLVPLNNQNKRKIREF